MIRQTAAWYRAYYERAASASAEHPVSMRDVTLGQIDTWRRGLMQAERT